MEGTRSLQDRPKPLYYAENKERFARFADKIIHVALDEDPQDKALYRRGPLDRLSTAMAVPYDLVLLLMLINEVVRQWF